jgi:exodeoxyribonuclease VIII
MNYNEIDALNWSTLKLMSVSPAYAQHIFNHPEEPEDKAAYVSGRAIHCAVLEPDKFDDRYIARPNFGDGRTKKAKEAKAAWLESIPDGVEIISIADYDAAINCSVSIQSNEYASKYLDGAKFEHIITWEQSGVNCKGRVDALTDRVVDLKSTRRNILHDVERDAAMFDYHAQLAWYHDGAVAAGLISGEKLPVAIFVHATTKSEFVDIAILDMEGVSGTLEYGRAKYKKLLNQYIGCKATNWWPGMAPRPIMWVLPEWKMMRDIDD